MKNKERKVKQGEYLRLEGQTRLRKNLGRSKKVKNKPGRSNKVKNERWKVKKGEEQTLEGQTR
ncbi:MAG: hypothetical protein GY719_40910 [bacterium]|nr:hypothetical protein [bacterium]